MHNHAFDRTGRALSKVKSKKTEHAAHTCSTSTATSTTALGNLSRSTTPCSVVVSCADSSLRDTRCSAKRKAAMRQAGRQTSRQLHQRLGLCNRQCSVVTSCADNSWRNAGCRDDRQTSRQQSHGMQAAQSNRSRAITATLLLSAAAAGAAL